MKIIRSPRFDRAYKKLPPEIQQRFKKQLQLLVESRFAHPLLRVKKIKGTIGIWEARIDDAYRFTFEKVESGLRLRVIGRHEILDRP